MANHIVCYSSVDADPAVVTAALNTSAAAIIVAADPQPVKTEGYDFNISAWSAGAGSTTNVYAGAILVSYQG
jgi:hypothetical protein